MLPKGCLLVILWIVVACGKPIVIPLRATSKIGRSSAAASPSILQGCPWIDFSAEVEVNGVPFQLIVDSGSTTLAVASSLCTNCDSISPRYVPTGMSLGSAQASYGDGSSWAARIYRDLVTISTLPPVSLLFAGITSQGGSFFTTGMCDFGVTLRNQQQGILGTGMKALAVAGTQSYIDQLATQNPSIKRQFAIQLCPGGGRLFIGGYDPTFNKSAFQYTPMTSIGGVYYYYSVLVHASTFGGQSLGISEADWSSNGDPTFDSGTAPYTILPTFVIDAMVSILNLWPAWLLSSDTPDANDLFYNNVCILQSAFTEDQLNELFPSLNLTLHVAGSSGTFFDITIPAYTGWLIPAWSSNGTPLYCAGLVPYNFIQPLFGYSTLTNFYVLFDQDALVVGLAPIANVTCPVFNSSHLVINVTSAGLPKIESDGLLLTMLVLTCVWMFAAMLL